MLKKLPSIRLIFCCPQEGIDHDAGVQPTGTLLQPEPWAGGIAKEAVKH